MFYRRIIFCLTLVVLFFFECNYCHNILACCSPKEYTKRDYMRGDEFLGHGEIGNQYSFEFNYYNVICRTGTPYIHDLYCRNKGFFYKFFLQQHTTSRTYYLCWTIFEHVLKKLIGVVWIYKKRKAFEFYYGSVIGIGWYPQSLNFNKYFRIGFFDMFINLTSVFMNVCHFLCHQYFKKCKADMCQIEEYNSLSYDFLDEANQQIMLNWYKKTADSMNYILYLKTKVCRIYQTCYSRLYMKDFSSWLLGNILDSTKYILAYTIVLLPDFSLVNIKTCYGVKIKILTAKQIEKFFKQRFCSYFSNMASLSKARSKDGNSITITYAKKKSFIYMYGYESHFFFGERDHIFWLLLELFIPNIEINISALH